jgi:hypothetical protein
MTLLLGLAAIGWAGYSLLRERVITRAVLLVVMTALQTHLVSGRLQSSFSPLASLQCSFLWE